MSDIPIWLILLFAVPVACSVARRVRHANATIAAAVQDVAKREADRA